MADKGNDSCKENGDSNDSSTRNVTDLILYRIMASVQGRQYSFSYASDSEI